MTKNPNNRSPEDTAVQESSPSMTQTFIRSLEVTAGYLEHAGLFEFAKGLTFVLGPKGAFKSTVQELIRVCLGVDERRVAELLAKNGRITRALGGGTVRCELEVDGVRVVATRDVDSGVKLSRKVSLEGIEILSQGDIRTLAEDRERRLELVDQAHRGRRVVIQERRDELADRAAALGQRLLPVLKQIRAKSEDELSGTDAFTKLEALLADPARPKSPADLEAQREAHEERADLLSRTEEYVRVREDMLGSLHELCNRGRGLKTTAAALRKFSEKLGERGTPADDVAHMLEAAEETFARAEAWCKKAPPAIPIFQRFEAQLKDLDRPYERLLELEKGHKARIQEESGLRGVVAKAERARAEIAQLKKTEAKIREDRARLYAEIDALDAELRDLRERRVRELGKVSPHTIVELHVGARNGAFADALATLVGGAAPALRETVVTCLTPRALLDLIERRDVASLVALRARSHDAARLVERLESSNQLHALLEKVVLEDEVAITFKDGNVEKPVELLSEGQRATALLPLLIQLDRLGPILIDEPETHLDNRFIADALVTLLKRLKKVRQVIVITHNPNLVTLCEPDHVIVMDAAGPERAARPISGPFKLTKDEVVRIVEGGVRAFRERERRYALPALEDLEPTGEAEGVAS